MTFSVNTTWTCRILLQWFHPHCYVPIIFQMAVTQVLIQAALLGILTLDTTTAQSLTCAEPWQAAFMQVTNTTFPITAEFKDADLTYYRETLRYTEDEIDREREDAISHFNQRFGLDFSNVEPDDEGQRILGNATFRPFRLVYTSTVVYNRWIVRGPSASRCYRLMDGGFVVGFTGTVMLQGEYGGEEGIAVFSGESVLYGPSVLLDTCNQQPVIFQVESLTPLRKFPSDNWFISTSRIRNRQLGEGTVWTMTRVRPINSTTLRHESRQVYTFL